MTHPEHDPEQFRRRWDLVLPYRDEMLAVARRRVPDPHDAEDVVAAALLRTVEHPALDEARIGAFLCTTVKRLAVDVHRDRARQLAVGVRDAARAVPATPVEDVVCDRAEGRWMADRLRELPERERQVLAARVSGLTAQQTSAHLGLSAKATENAYTRVRRRASRLLAATLGGLGVLVAAGRRARPELALVPATVTTAALTFAVVVSAMPPTTDLTPSHAPAAVLDPQTTSSGSSAVGPAAPAPAGPEAVPAATPPAAVVVQPAPPEPAPEVPDEPAASGPQPLVEGYVYTEHRHTDESFEESVQRCVDGIGDLVEDPLVGTCQHAYEDE